MKQASIGVVLCSLVTACAALSGCGDDKTTTAAATTTTTGTAGSGGSGGSTGTGGTGGTGPSACTSELTIIFKPAYSAYDGVNVYKVPIIAWGVTSEVKWTASDPSMVDLDPNTVDFGDAGVMGKGVMVKTLKAGKVKISAVAGAACGETELTITQATPAGRELGNNRYNNGVPITFDGGTTPSCKNCHGTATPGQLTDVQHTPQQTGGYSDEELVNIFVKGEKPAGGGCRVLSCSTWSSFHKWTVTDEEKNGIVFYLRSLEPAPQGGIGFGGTRPPTNDQ